MKSQKAIKQSDMQRMLTEGKISLPPLKFCSIQLAPVFGGGRQLDAILEIRWGIQRRRFAVEMKALSTPMALRTAVNEVTSAKLPPDTLPMIMLPYLSAAQLQELAQGGVSGIDLCGNGVVVAPGELFVFRTGQPNRFPSSAPIKNIYRKNTSMVARLFLALPRIARTSEVLAEVNARNLLGAIFRRSPMVMGTVSKAIKALEEDLIVSRQQGLLRLIQADKLLDNLLDNYRPQNPGETVRRKVPLAAPELFGRLVLLGKELNLPVVATGLNSATRYAVMQRGELLSIYCPQPEALLSRLPPGESDRFPNLEIVTSEDETVYFDTRIDDETGFRWASPVQAYLEMMRGDKRDQETAVQVRAEIIRAVGNLP